MIIPRDAYLKKLIAGQGNGLIKIITGLRRSGKSFLLFRLFADYLKEKGVMEDHIIKVDLEDRRRATLRDPDNLLAYIDSNVRDQSHYYVLLDEVQHVKDFEDVLNSYLKIDNVDIYVTGSNSKFLSSDIITEFRGRSDQIYVRPLSFAEFMTTKQCHPIDAWPEYYTYGGLPHLVNLDSPEQKSEYLKNLSASVYVRDIVERYRIEKEAELKELMLMLASAIGSPTNPNKLSNSFKSLKKVCLSYKTIDNFLSYLTDAFMVEKAVRYDIKGKKYINSLSKYYFTDLGIRNAMLNFRQQEESHIMENIIYNELRSRGFSVDVGFVEHRTNNKERQTIRKQYEVDFVANQGSQRYYIQSVLSIADKKKEEQELASFSRITDSFSKIIIVKDHIMPKINDSGIMYIGLLDFLLSKNFPPRWN